MMKLKKYIGTGILIASSLFSLADKANSSILYTQKQAKQDVKLEEVLTRINQKYPGKNPEYFSRGFLQFKPGELVNDVEISKLIQDSYLKDSNDSNEVESINFNNNYCIMIEQNAHHIGDDEKSWFPIKKSEAVFYEKIFTIEDINDLKNPRLGIETFLAHADNLVYINGKKIGFLPRITKKQWGDLLSKHKDKTPFFYGELDVLGVLNKGENTLRIESVDYGKFSSNYNDFLIRRMQIVYDKTGENKNDNKGK